MRHFPRARLAALITAVSVVAAACGGGDDTAEPGPGETADSGAVVQSDDGILTIEVPDGAVEDGVTIGITALVEADLPPELQLDDTAVVAYELTPDGAEFSAPLVVTFRVDPAALGIDLGPDEVPIGLLVSEDESGELISLGGELSRDGDTVVARAEQSHFTPDFLVLSETVAVAMEPPRIDLAPLGVASTSVAVADTAAEGRVSLRAIPGLNAFDIRWRATTPFVVASDFDELPATISCTRATSGEVPDAYTVRITPELEIAEELVLGWFKALDIFGVGASLAEAPSFILGGVGTCTEEGSVPEGSVPADVPEEFQSATPESVGISDDGIVSVSFTGAAQEVLEGADLASAVVSVRLLEGTVSTTLTAEFAAGETTVRSFQFDDADAEVDDDGGSSIVTLTGSATHEWTDAGTLGFTETVLDLPSDPTVEVQVILDTPDGDFYSLDLRPPA